MEAVVAAQDSARAEGGVTVKAEVAVTGSAYLWQVLSKVYEKRSIRKKEFL